MTKKFMLLISIPLIAMSRIWTEVGLGPGCRRIKHLSLHRQLLVKEAMLLAFIIEQKFCFFSWHCMQTFLPLPHSLPLPQTGYPMTEGVR